MTKILIVDDEPSLLRSTAMLLRAKGYEVVTASEASRVLPILVEEKPDLILQDVRMPGLDIDHHVSEIRTTPGVADTPVILFSATLELPEIHERVGAEGRLEKPFRVHQLEKAIEDALGEGQASRSIPGGAPR